MAQLRPTRSPAAALFDGRPLTPIASVVFKLGVAIATWESHKRTRRKLRHLDDHLLRDIGVTRELAEREAARPFWQG